MTHTDIPHDIASRSSKTDQDTSKKPIGRLRLQAIQVVDYRDANRGEPGPIIQCEPHARRQKDDIAARIWIGFAILILLCLPFAIELEHRVDHETLGAQRMVMMVAVTMVRMVHCGFGRSFRVAAQEPIGHRAVVVEAVTEIGVLRPFRCNRVEDVAVDRPPALGLRQSEPEHGIPGAGAGLELRFKQLALIVALAGLSGRRPDAGEQRGLKSSILAIKAILAEQR